MNDPASAERWRTVLNAGMKNQNDRLWNGEYYIQIPDPHPAEDYDTGCHADQLLGQWWAHMLDLGYLYPAPRVKSALSAVMKHNFRQNVRRIQTGAAALYSRRRWRADHLHVAARRPAQAVHPVCRRGVDRASNTRWPAR